MNKKQLLAILVEIPADAFSIIVIGHNTKEVFFSTHETKALETFETVNESKQISRSRGGGFRCRAIGALKPPYPEHCVNPARCAGYGGCPRNPVCID